MTMHGIDTGPITMINVFEIDHDDIEPFLQGWRERAEFMSKQPGFRSFRLHRAQTPDARFQLVNVAEWESADALHAARAHQYFQESTRRSMEGFEVTAHPAIYRVAVEVIAD